MNSTVNVLYFKTKSILYSHSYLIAAAKPLPWAPLRLEVRSWHTRISGSKETLWKFQMFKVLLLCDCCLNNVYHQWPHSCRQQFWQLSWCCLTAACHIRVSGTMPRPWTDLVRHSERHQKNMFLSSVRSGETRYPGVTFCFSHKLARMRLNFIKPPQNLKKKFSFQISRCF